MQTKVILAFIALIVSVFGQRGDMGFIEDDESIIPLPNDDSWRGDFSSSWEAGTGPIVSASTFGEIQPVHYQQTIQENFETPYGYIGHLGKACKVLKGYGNSGIHHEVYQSFGHEYQAYPSHNNFQSVNAYPVSGTFGQSFQPTAYPASAQYNAYPVSGGTLGQSLQPTAYPASEQYNSYPASSSFSQQEYPSYHSSSSAMSYPVYPTSSNSVSGQFENSQINGGSFSSAQSGMFFPGSDNSYQ